MNIQRTWKNRKKILKLVKQQWFEIFCRTLMLLPYLLLLCMAAIGEYAEKLADNIDYYLDERFVHKEK